MSLSNCDNTIFCSNLDNKEVFSIVYNHLLPKFDYSINFTEYDNLVENVLDDISNISSINQLKERFQYLYKFPNNITQHKYIFVGFFDNDIKSILDKIEKQRNFLNVDIDKLNNYFGYNVIQKWGIDETLASVKFIPIMVLQDDTINSLLNIISSYIDYNTIPFVYDNIYLFSQQMVDINNIMENIKYSVLEQQKINKFKFNIQQFKTTLSSHMIPDSIIEKIVTKHNNSIDNIPDILDEPSIRLFIELFYTFKSNTYTLYNKNKFILPVDSYIFNYMNSENKYLLDSDVTSPQIYANKSFINNTISFNGKPINNTYFIYNFNNITSNQLSIRNIDIDNSEYEEIFKSFIGKLFPFIKKTDYRNIMDINIDNDEYRNNRIQKQTILDKYSYITTIYERFSDLNNNPDIDIKLTNNYLLQFYHRVYLPVDFDLLTIFNELKLSYDLPFVKYRDSTTREMVYKIFKPITQKKSNLYNPIVSKDTLSNWIKNYGYEFINDSLKTLRGNPKELYYKLKLLDIKIPKLLTGKIFKINEDSYDILFDDHILDSIPRNFIEGAGNIDVDDEVSFYRFNTIYADVEVSKKGFLQVTIDSTNLDTDDLEDTLFNIKEKINNFINYMYSIEPLKSVAIYDNNIDYSNIVNYGNNKKSYLKNFIYKYTIKLPKDYPITYNELYNVSRLLYPFVIVNDRPFVKNDEIEFYDESTDQWINGKILTYDIDGNYSINLYDVDKGYNRNVQKDNINRIYLRSKITDDIQRQFELIYKRVPNFNNLPPIKNLIYKLNNSGFSKQLIVQRVMETFDIKNDEAIELINQVIESVDAKSLDKLSGELGISIKIDYLNAFVERDDKFINIFIENVHSIENTNRIFRFIQLLFNLYITKVGLAENAFLSEFVEDTVGLTNKETVEEVNNIEKIQIKENIDVFEADDIDFGDDLDLLGEGEELILEDEEEPIALLAEEGIDTTAETRENIQRLDKEIRLESTLSTQVRKNGNFILDSLYENDPELFATKTEQKENPFVRQCQANRYPKILSDEQKQLVDDKYSGSYSISSNSKSCSNINDIKTKSSCNAIKWGSTSENKRWYICPRIYDMLDGIPLNWYDLTYNPPTGLNTFEPLNLQEGWRTDKTTGRDILDFNPSFKGRKPIGKSKNIYPTVKESLLLVAKDNNYTYPGFLNPSKHPKSMYVPCCFSTDNKRISEAFGVMDEIVRPSNDYIQGWGKELGHNPHRIGLLPKILNQYFDIDPEKITTGEFNQELTYFLRRGIKQDNNSFLSLIANLKSDEFTTNDLINGILTNLDIGRFSLLNRSNLDVEFRNIGEQTSFQNYLEYTISDEYKHWRYFYEYLTQPNDWLFKNGINLIIVEYKIKNNREKAEILCPYFCNIDRDVDKPICIALKNNLHFEPIYFFNKNTRPVRFFNKENPIISPLLNLLFSKCQEEYPSKLVDLAKFNNIPIFTKKLSLLDTLLILRDNITPKNSSFKYKYLIRDQYNKIIGVYLENRLIIPVYPDATENNVIYGEVPVVNIGYKQLVYLPIKEYIKLYRELSNLTNGTIDIYPVKYFMNSDNLVEGFISNVGVYLETELSRLGDTNISKKNNYLDTDKLLLEFEKSYKKTIYKDKPNLEEVLDILEKINKKYKISTYKPKYFISKNGIDKEALVTENNILVPFKPVKIVEGDGEIHDKFEIANIIEYLNRNIELVRLTDYKLPCLVVKGLMDKTKKYTKLMLECDYSVNLSINKRFYINESHAGKYIISYINNNPIVDQLFGNLIYNRNIFIDQRILNAEKLKYYSDIYELIRYELYLLLHNPKYIKTVIFLGKILNNTGLTVAQKRHILTPLFKLLMSTIVKTVLDDGSIEIFPKINIERSCNKNGCQEELCTREKVNLKRISSLDQYIEFSYISRLEPDYIKKLLKKHGLQVKSNADTNRETLLSYVKSNLGVFEEKSLEEAFIIYNEYIEKTDKKYCKVILYDSVDRQKYENITTNILEELLRNNYKRNQILVKFTTVKLKDRYKAREPFEILILEKELSDMFISNLYHLVKKKYYNNYELFDEHISDYAINIHGTEVSVMSSIDKCVVKNAQEYSIKFTGVRKMNNNNSENNNIVKLTRSEYSELYNYIFSINTILTKCEVGKIDNYDVKITNSTKVLL